MSTHTITVTQGTHTITVTQGTQTFTITLNRVATIAGTFRKIFFTTNGTAQNISTTNDELMRANSSIVILNGIMQFQGSTRQYIEDSDLKGITFNSAVTSGWNGMLMYVKG